MNDPRPELLRPSSLPEELYVFTTGQDVHQASLDDYAADPTEPWSWTAQRRMKRGAYFLLYVTHPISAFCWIGRACCDAEEPASAQGRSCLWVQMHPLARPLSLAEARAHPIIGTWRAIAGRAQLQGSSRRVHQPEVWDALLTLLAERDPKTISVLEDWRTTPPPRPSGTLADFFWEGGPGWDYPFRRERPLQEGVRDYFIGNESFRVPQASDGVWLKDLEVRLGAENRADVILVAEDEREPTLLVIETKLFAVDPRGVEQLSRYSDWIDTNQPEWRVRRILCAQEFSESALEMAAGNAVECWQVAWPDEEDGYGADEVDWVLGPLSPTEPLPTPEELGRRAKAVGARLAEPALRRSLQDVGEISARRGLIAYWPASPTVAAALGLREDAAGAPLWIEAATHIPKSLNALAQGGTAFGDLLRMHLGISCDSLPWWWVPDKAMDSVGLWTRSELRVSWVEDMDPVSLRRPVAELLDASFQDLRTDTHEELADRFSRKAVRGVLLADAIEKWGGWLSDAAADWIAAAPAVGVNISVDREGLPVDWKAGRASSGRAVFIPADVIANPLAQLLRNQPGWDGASEALGPSPAWDESVEALEAQDQLAVAAYLLAQPLISSSIAP